MPPRPLPHRASSLRTDHLRPAFRGASFLGTASLMLWLAGGAFGAETVTIEARRLAELEARAKDADRLEREVAELRQRLATFESSATPPSVRAPVVGTPIVGPPQVSAPVIPPQAVLPKAAPTPEPPKPVEPRRDAEPRFSAEELIRLYETDTAAADRAVAGQVLEVKGVVSWAEKPLLGAPYLVVFALQNSKIRVESEVVPDRKFQKVYVTTDRLRVVGETATQRLTLLRLGDRVTLSGRCAGWKDGAVRLTRCMLQSVEAGGTAVEPGTGALERH